MYKVNVLLDCHHVNFYSVESAPFAPKKGDKVVCKICFKETTVKRISAPVIEKQKEN